MASSSFQRPSCDLLIGPWASAGLGVKRTIEFMRALGYMLRRLNVD
jgi:hypothetical protein